jgi:hypothetical protein
MSELIFHDNWLIFIGLVVILLVAVLELTYRFGGPLVKHFETDDEMWNALQTGLLALVAFMMGFSFAQAQGRYDARRELVVQEANAIGTTWLRADQLSAPQREAFKRALYHYTAIRLQAYSAPGNVALFDRELNDSERDQDTLWSIASGDLRAHQTNLGYSLLMQTLNDTIDDASAQRAALSQHVPLAAVLLTLLLVVIAVFSLGLSFARVGARPAVFSMIYIAALALVFEMFIDYDRPQTGLITVSLAPLQTQLESMHP